MHGRDAAGPGRGRRGSRQSIDAGAARGHKGEPGNLSRGTYSWWTNTPGRDVFLYRPRLEGEYRVWLSWGCGWPTHTTDARYLLDRDGDPSTTKDLQEIAVVDQQRFADGSGNPITGPTTMTTAEGGTLVINPDGTVAKPNVTEADPPRIFNTSAMRAILRWKFKPRIVNGKPVSRRGVQVIEFKLEEHV